MNKEEIQKAHVNYIDSMNKLTEEAKNKMLEDVFAEIDIVEFIDDPDRFKNELVETFMGRLQEYLDSAIESGTTMAGEIISGTQTGP